MLEAGEWLRHDRAVSSVDSHGTEQSEQSLNNSLPNTTHQQVLTRATGTKNPRVQSPELERDFQIVVLHNSEQF
jgi:hypothetical protein